MIKYCIFYSLIEFQEKNNEIISYGLYSKCLEYCNHVFCKHPKENKWAMPVLPEVEKYFEDTISKLSDDWKNIFIK